MKRKGFTLIELIIAITIASIVSLGITSLFVSNLRMSRAILTHSMLQTDLQICVTELTTLITELPEDIEITEEPNKYIFRSDSANYEIELNNGQLTIYYSDEGFSNSHAGIEEFTLLPADDLRTISISITGLVEDRMVTIDTEAGIRDKRAVRGS